MCQCIVYKLYEKGHDNNKCLLKAAKQMAFRWSPFKNKIDPEAGQVSTAICSSQIPTISFALV